MSPMLKKTAILSIMLAGAAMSAQAQVQTVRIGVTTSPNPNFFPAMPQAMPCRAEDLKFEWHLVALYEVPNGAEMQALRATPNQKIFFDHITGEVMEWLIPPIVANMDSTQKKIQEEADRRLREETPKGVLSENIWSGQANRVSRYALNNGLLYYYEKGAAEGAQPIGSHACFSVINGDSPFQRGQLLLMAPANADGTPPSTRLAKLYSRYPIGATYVPTPHTTTTIGDHGAAAEPQPGNNTPPRVGTGPGGVVYESDVPTTNGTTPPASGTTSQPGAGVVNEGVVPTTNGTTPPASGTTSQPGAGVINDNSPPAAAPVAVPAATTLGAPTQR